MTGSEPSAERPKEEADAHTIERIEVTVDDPAVAARWQEGIVRWGDAFIAFTQLRLPELHTDEVFTTFEDFYMGSYNDLTEAAVAQIDALGWKDAVYKLRRDQGIADDILVWNHQAFIDMLTDVYEVVRAGGKVHLFAR